MPLLYTTPPGWKKSPLGDSDGAYSIMRGKSGIVFTVASARDQPPEPRDSRHLLWTASRFASVWKLPLQQWSTPRQWRVYEADRKHPRRDTHVISGANGKYEFEVIAFVYDPETAADVYAALDVIFATTSDAAGNHIFGELTATKLTKKIVPSASSGAEWVIGRQTIRIPAGWAPDDTVFPTPVSYSPNLAPSSLGLSRIGGEGASGFQLDIQWLQAQELNQKYGQHRDLGWKIRSEQWKNEAGIALKLQPRVTPLTESFAGIASKTISGTGANAFSLRWYYRSRRLALSAFGRAPTLQSCDLHEKALTDIIRQLE